MRKIFIAIFLYSFLGPATGFSQTVNFEDGFEDADFTDNPTWSGDTEQYTIIDGTPNFLLRLQGDANNGGVSFLSTPSSNVEGSWEFFVNLDFSPSNGNRTDIFLMSNIADLEGPVNGYALRGGEGGSDDVFRIVRYAGGSEDSTVLSGTTDISGGGEFRVQVTRQSGGIWTLEVGQGYDGALSQEGGTATDSTYTNTDFFGVRSTYTSSRADLFTYDFKIDLPPFTVTDATAEGNRVDVSFNQPYDQASVQPGDFSVDNGIGSPASVTFPSTTVIRLTYGSELPSNEYSVTAQNIQAENGNALEAGASASFFVFANFVPGDVIINEFMYDPPGGQAEYVELKNISDKFLNLQNWQIGDNTGTGTISTNALTLRPNDFIAISTDTAALFSVYGPRPYAESGGLPSLNNSGDAIQVFTENNAQVDSLQYTPAWGGDNVAIERRSNTAPSVFMENFGDSPDALGGTPGIANEIPDDTTPPDLNDLNIADNQTLDLAFSERPDSGTATNTGNYSLDNGIGINNAQQTAPDSVRLSLDSPLQNGTEYQLTITNQQDIFGNTSGAIDTTFSFFIVTPADSGDIFINEFMYDPPQGSSEFIELFNPTDESFDLNGWTINDNTGALRTITDSRFIVPPESYAVIAPDNSLLDDNPDITLVSMGNGFPSLNNSGDGIVLRRADGTQLDSLTYTPNFGGSGVALERRTTNVAPIQANFGDSPNGFGTPGRQNQVPPDNTPPDIASFTIIGNQSLQFVFTERVEGQSAANTANYTLSGGISVASATLSGGDSVRVDLSDPLQNNTRYTATIDGVEDIFGNALANRDTTFTFFEITPADSGDIFINEFTYDPPQGSTEYIELFNPTDESFDLNGWTINDNTGNQQVITDSRFVVSPGSFVVLAPDNTLLADNPGIALAAMGSRFPALNNSGDDIVLRRADGIRLDSLRYTPGFGGSGVALERRKTSVAPIQANFGDAPNSFGTPGEVNEIPEDTIPPDLTGLEITDNRTLALAFSEGLAGGLAATAGNYSLTNGITVNAAQQVAADSVRLILDSPLQNGTEYQLSVRNQQDIFGNNAADIDTSFTFFEISEADPDEIFINEFTYDPPAGSVEYIELINTSSQSFDLSGWTINDNTGNRQAITNSRTVVPPNSFVVISTDQTLRNNFPNINLVTMASRFPSLNNSGDDIVLRRADGIRLDSLTYTPDYGGNNIAVERRTVDAPPVQGNFGDAPNGFGTPGSRNEIPEDTTPPNLSESNTPDRQTVNLLFTEDLNSTNANNINNYNIDNGINITNAQQVTNSSVNLILDSPLQNGVEYQLTINNQQDIFGNTAEAIETGFQFTSDTTPPDIASFSIIGNQSLQFVFTEQVEEQSAANTANYTLSGGISVASATLSGGDSVRVDLSDPLQNNTRYTATIEGVEDIFGNTLVNRDTTFSFFEITPADSGDIFINEFTYDPPEGSTEYIELFNPTDESFDLNGWTINDNTGNRRVITNSQTVVPPDSFIVIAPDITLLTDNPDIALVAVGSRFPSLNNNGDDIVLRNSTGTRLDSLTYTPDFGGSGVALERRKTSVAPIQANFGDAPDGFGTPGRTNQIGADTTPPDLSSLNVIDRQTLDIVFTERINNSNANETDNYTIDNGIAVSSVEQTAGNMVRLRLDSTLQNGIEYQLSITNQQDIFGNTNVSIETSLQFTDDTNPPDLTGLEIPDNQTLVLAFSEGLEEGPAATAGNYSLSNGLTVNAAQLSDADSVRLSLDSPLQNGTEYQLTITNQQDIFGNTSGAIDTTFSFFIVTPADSGDIFINEFTFDPPEGSTEYIELFNPTDESFDLNGWTINDNTDNRRVITNSRAVVPPDSFIVIAPDNTLLTDNPDIALVVMGSRFPSLNNNGDNIVLRNSTGARLDSLTYTPDFGGNNIAVERRTIDVPPFEANFGEAPNGFGTPGRANQIGADNTPPVLIGLEIPDDQTLILAFTEGLAKDPATTASNYTLNNGIGVNTVQQTTTDSVLLSLDSPLQNGAKYQLVINNQQDIFGNTAEDIDTVFTFFEISTADSGEIFINEFTYDPPTGSVEYIELINTTSQSFNLNGWTINDNTGNRRVITDSRTIVPPDSFVVIAPDQTFLSDFPDINLVTMGSRFPSLNNNGDNIVLHNATGARLDSLTYTPDFGGNNIAIERRTTAVLPLEANFGDAPNGFGTPGSVNDIPPDVEAPVLDNIRILDKTTLQLLFSESITGETAIDQTNYTITPNRNIQLISSVQDTVTLFLSQPLESGQTYQITVRNLRDIFGNTIAETAREVDFLEFSDVAPGDIVINEILYNRAGAGSPEFVELFNRTNQNFDLSGWRISDASNTATIDAGTRLPAGGYLVITDNASLANMLDNAVFLSSFPSLNDDEDLVYIRTNGGTTIDSLAYNPDFGGTTDGKSAERIDPNAASNDPANFATSTAEDGSTPGEQNSVFARDEIPPAITFSRIFPNSDIEVRFSEFIRITPDLTFMSGGENLQVDSFNPDNGNIIFLNTPSGVTPGSELTITANNLRDVSGNVTAASQIAVAQPLNPGDVVINEILFDPLADSDDNRPDQAEYIELRNIRDYAISLEGITLHDAPDEDGEVRTLTPVSTNSKFIPAQGTTLVYAEDETPAFSQSKVAQFFNLNNPSANTIIRVDRSSLRLASADDAIFLTGSEGVEIDSVFYDENWHNPNLIDTDGVALERINPFGPSNDDANWGSSTAEVGGTPNAENSLFQTPGEGDEDEIGISFSTNPFSPDGDGTEDNLFINYTLNQPDYLITVRIYDRYGRLVRELADGRQAGFEGSLIWDGLKDDGTRNRIGIYIVIFKAFSSAGGDNCTFKETVVLARRLD